MNGDVGIFNLNPGTIRHEYAGSLIEMILYDINHDKRIYNYTPLLSGACLGIFRNSACKMFLDMANPENGNNLEWMMFVDSDIVLQPDTLDRLLKNADPVERPIIAGLYFHPLAEGVVPSIFNYETDKELNLQRMMPVEKYEKDTLVECDGTGAGCLLIHGSVLIKLQEVYRLEPWFAESVYNGVTFGEDFTFCLRARHEGYPIYVDTSVKVGHVKNYVLTEEFYLAMKDDSDGVSE